MNNALPKLSSYRTTKEISWHHPLINTLRLSVISRVWSVASQIENLTLHDADVCFPQYQL